MKSKLTICLILFFCMLSHLTFATECSGQKAKSEKMLKCEKFCPAIKSKVSKSKVSAKTISKEAELENTVVSFIKDKILFFTRYFPDDLLLKNLFEIDSQKPQVTSEKEIWMGR